MNIRCLALLIALPVMAADPPGFVLWTAGDLKAMERKLETKTDGAHFASQPLEKFGNHYTMLAHRQGKGSAELHETDADIFVVETGTAKLIVGGKVVGAKTTAPHEVRGPSIEGGEEKQLAAGDIVHIPARVPHQVVPTSPKFTYFVIKVTGQ